MSEQNEEKIVEGRLRDPGFWQESMSNLPILNRVAMESVRGMLETCPFRTLSDGEMLMTAGDRNHNMYVVVRGRLSVHLEKPDSEPIAFVEDGQTVGELSVIDDSPICAFVRTTEPTLLLEIHEEAFWRMIEASHEFAINMLLLLSRRLRQNNFRIIDGIQRRAALEQEATVDALTGLRNRRWLDRNFPRMMERHRFSHKSLCVLMIDVDHFKRFNDEFGHLAGDRVLVSVAEVIATRLRPTDLASRYGGEEFCIMLPDTPLSGGMIAAERLRAFVADNTVHDTNGRRLPPVTISLGLGDLRSEDDVESMLLRVDAALYRAKEAGRNRVAVAK